jgi:hypothetical protein
MKIEINKFTEAEQHKFSDGRTNDPLYAGNFGHKAAKNWYTLYLLTDEDKNFLQGCIVNEGDQFFRCQTDRMKAHPSGGIKPLVKINLNNGLCYFLTEMGNRRDIADFETRGTQMVFLNLKVFPEPVKTEQVLWGCRVGMPDYMEEILSTKPENFDRVEARAMQDGWDRFRVATIDLSTPPNFTGTIKSK